MNLGSRLPNLFILGAQKSGTSTLYNMLNVHPDIFMSRQKELDFFSKPSTSRGSFETYLENFAEAGDQRYVGEATPHYFNSARDNSRRSPVAQGISQMVGSDVRLVLILRDPVVRTLAGWKHNIIHGSINADVSPFNAPPGQGIIHLSHYARHWGIWHDYFAHNCFHVSLFDDLAERPQGMLHDILTWLELGPATAAYTDYNFGHKFNTASSNRVRRNVASLPRIDLDTVHRLCELFSEDTEMVRRITGRSLSHWGQAKEICDWYNASVA